VHPKDQLLARVILLAAVFGVTTKPPMHMITHTLDPQCSANSLISLSSKARLDAPLHNYLLVSCARNTSKVKLKAEINYKLAEKAFSSGTDLSRKAVE